MRVASLNDLFVEQLKDLYSAESQAEQAYRRWAEAADSQLLKDVIEGQLDGVRRHRDVLMRICKDLGVEPTGHKCRGMEGLVREGDEFLNDVVGDAVRDAGIVASLNRIEHYGIAGYGCARSYALHLDLNDAAEMLQQILDEDADIDERLTELAEGVLNEQAMSSAS